MVQTKVVTGPHRVGAPTGTKTFAGVEPGLRSVHEMGLTTEERLAAIDLKAVRGWGRLACEATAGLADVVEAMHHTIARAPGILGTAPSGRTRGITGLVYGSIRGVTRLVGTGFDGAGALGRLAPPQGPSGRIPSPQGEAVLAVLNGVIGHHLAATGNPLAIPMRLRQGGRPLTLERQALAAALPQARGKVLVLVHGSCRCDLQWSRLGHEHGAALSRDLACTPLYLHYNTGLHVSSNGRAFSDTLATLVREWPVEVEDLLILTHSMGGLVARSACHYGAGQRWLQRLSALVFLGTPHQGAPLERGGSWVDTVMGISPYTAPLSRLGQIRSAGITDLRHGSILDEDWEGRDRFGRARERPRAVPLPAGVPCYAVAATRSAVEGDLAGALLGDGLVPVSSAMGRDTDPRRALHFPESRQWVGRGMNHFDLLSHPEVYDQLKRWLEH